MNEETLFALALWLLPGMGPSSFEKLLGAAPRLEEIFSLSEMDLRALGLKAPLIKALKDKDQALKKAQEELQRLRLIGAQVISIFDAPYPSLLKEIPHPPPVLFVKGSLELGPYSLAVVGSRAATSYGRRITKDWISELARAGLDIISGFALGIDTLAHQAALRAGGYTVAVLGCGLDQNYPAENRLLREEIVKQGGALITEFPLGTKPKPQNFPVRNRIISGLARGVLVIEASAQSGSLITARLAAEQGREVMAIPGSIYSGRSHGCHRLIREGALLVDRPDQILEALGLEVVFAEPRSDVKELTLSSLEDKVLKCMEVYPIHVDDIAHRSGLAVSQVSGILLALELKGLVQGLPGNFYQRVVER